MANKKDVLKKFKRIRKRYKAVQRLLEKQKRRIEKQSINSRFGLTVRGLKQIEAWVADRVSEDAHDENTIRQTISNRLATDEFEGIETKDLADHLVSLAILKRKRDISSKVKAEAKPPAVIRDELNALKDIEIAVEHIPKHFWKGPSSQPALTADTRDIVKEISEKYKPLPLERIFELIKAIFSLHKALEASKLQEIPVQTEEAVSKIYTELSLPEEPDVVHVVTDVVERAMEHHEIPEEPRALPIEQELKALEAVEHEIEKVPEHKIPKPTEAKPAIITEPKLPAAIEEPIKKRLQEMFPNLPTNRLGEFVHAIESLHAVISTTEPKQLSVIKDSLPIKLSRTLYPNLEQMDEIRKILKTSYQITERAVECHLKALPSEERKALTSTAGQPEVPEMLKHHHGALDRLLEQIRTGFGIKKPEESEKRAAKEELKTKKAQGAEIEDIEEKESDEEPEPEGKSGKDVITLGQNIARQLAEQYDARYLYIETEPPNNPKDPKWIERYSSVWVDERGMLGSGYIINLSNARVTRFLNFKRAYSECYFIGFCPKETVTKYHSALLFKYAASAIAQMSENEKIEEKYFNTVKKTLEMTRVIEGASLFEASQESQHFTSEIVNFIPLEDDLAETCLKEKSLYPIPQAKTGLRVNEILASAIKSQPPPEPIDREAQIHAVVETEKVSAVSQKTEHDKLYNEILTWVAQTNSELRELEIKIEQSKKQLENAEDTMKRRDLATVKAICSQIVADGRMYLNDIEKMKIKIDEFIKRLEAMS